MFVYLYVCLFVCLSICMFVYLYVCLFVCLPICMLAYLYVCLFVCLSICMFVYLYVCLFVCSSARLFPCLSVCFPPGYLNKYCTAFHVRSWVKIGWKFLKNRKLLCLAEINEKMLHCAHYIPYIMQTLIFTGQTRRINKKQWTWQFHCFRIIWSWTKGHATILSNNIMNRGNELSDDRTLRDTRSNSYRERLKLNFCNSLYRFRYRAFICVGHNIS